MVEQHQRLGLGELKNSTRPIPCIRASGETKNQHVEDCLTEPALSESNNRSWATLLNLG
jgi:hypothetical protein